MKLFWVKFHEASSVYDEKFSKDAIKDLEMSDIFDKRNFYFEIHKRKLSQN